jgi:hypothetical protein
LKLVDDAEGIAVAVESLRRSGFRDGVEELRWLASQDGTWSVRARDLLEAASGAARMKVASSNELSCLGSYADYPALHRR